MGEDERRKGEMEEGRKGGKKGKIKERRRSDGKGGKESKNK